jgi:Ham1 family
MICRVVGWDPIFEYEGKTYAEMDKAEKVSGSLLSCPICSSVASVVRYANLWGTCRI